jgi:hypothetical protein
LPIEPTTDTVTVALAGGACVGEVGVDPPPPPPQPHKDAAATARNARDDIRCDMGSPPPVQFSNDDANAEARQDEDYPCEGHETAMSGLRHA